MALKLYNTLSRSEELFIPIKNDSVSLYTCGPTVYNYPHIGNYRAYIFGDTLKRVLTYAGYDVDHIMNLTDIDDKTIRDSQKAGKSLKEFTEYFTEEFYKDRDALNIVPAKTYTKATEYIPEMVAMIEILLKKGVAYKGDDGSVYFSIAKDPDYGKLTHIKKEELSQNASGRLRQDEYDKDNVQDFALWKAWDSTDGDVFWETTLGKGRPGWHIECSAMSIATLGETIDIHTGGLDNMFPHHENEIAQSESTTGKTFVKYWMHNAWLLVDGKKMAKSLGNFYTLRDLTEKGFDPLSYRYLTLITHYRTPLNFTFDALQAAENALHKLYQTYEELPEKQGTVVSGYQEKFKAGIENDLGTPTALAVVWELVKDNAIAPEDKRTTLLDFDRVLGFGLTDRKKEIIPEQVQKLADEREMARQEKNWARADELRKEIEDNGYTVKDSEIGPKISKL